MQRQNSGHYYPLETDSDEHATADELREEARLLCIAASYLRAARHDGRLCVQRAARLIRLAGRKEAGCG